MFDFPPCQRENPEEENCPFHVNFQQIFNFSAKYSLVSSQVYKYLCSFCTFLVFHFVKESVPTDENWS